MEIATKPKVVKVGWVRKRSAYLKQWRGRWLVLSTAYICTYKTEDVSQQPTERIPISSVTELSAQQPDLPPFSTFKVTTPTRVYYMSSDSSASNEDWLRAIEETRQLILQIPVMRKKELCKSRENSETHVFEFFNELNGMMTERLEGLKRDLERTSRDHQSQATLTIQRFEHLSNQSEENYSKFEQIYRDPSLSAGEKLQLVRKIRPEVIDLREFDAMVDSRVFVSVPESLPAVVLKGSLKVSMENVREVKVRRTLITRALKWRYNGERIDALSFSTSKDVLLTAVGLCTPYKPSLSLQIRELKLLLGPTTQSPVTYTHNSLTEIHFEETESVHKLTLSKPQPIRANSIFTVYVKAWGASSYKCVDCVSTLPGPGDVVWTFMNTTFQGNDQNNRTDAVCGPIADFFYMLAVES